MQAILGGAAVLVIMLAVGLALLLSGDNGDGPAGDSEAAAAVQQADDQEPAFDLASWTSEASAACRTVATEHQALAATDEAPVADLDAAVRSLTSAVREIPLPTAEEHRASALTVVARGDEAEQAWDGIAGQQRDDLSRAEMNEATGATQDFVTALVEVGADCDILH